MILGTYGNACTPMSFENREIDQILGLGKHQRQSVNQNIMGRIARIARPTGITPIEQHIGKLHSRPPQTSLIVHIRNIRELGLHYVPHIIGKQAGGIADADVAGVHPRGVHQLPQQRHNYVRRIVDVIQHPRRFVIRHRINPAVLGIARIQVDLTGYLLARLIAYIPLAPLNVVLAENRIPGLGDCILP